MAQGDPSSPRVRTSLVGSSIGNLRLTQVLGEGGMGTVYLAEHPRLRRSSAIKVLHPWLVQDSKAVKRFFDEAHASNAIRHPNIVDIYDCGTLPDLSPYIVMEYLEGETLASRLQRGPLPIGVALDYMCQAASALAAAESKGIVHRDLKPENLFLTSDRADRRRVQVKVLDFGIAKLQQNFHETPERTGAVTLIGTPLYMSPEQCLAEPEVDSRSDVYSLAVILYEMLLGHPPFVGKSAGVVMNMHVNLLPERLRPVRPEIPAPLEMTLLRALAKNPDKRLSSVSELLAELRVEKSSLDAAASGGDGEVVLEGAGAPVHKPSPSQRISTLVTLAEPPSAALPMPRRRLGRARKIGRVALLAFDLVALGALAHVYGKHDPDPAPAAAVRTSPEVGSPGFCARSSP
jgi:serine/threonine-protein kinase